jgi:hypothetical protein
MGKKKPIPKSKNIVKQDLSAIENKLSECARKGKSVFLYGKDSADRKIIVKEISKSIFNKRKIINCQRMDGEDVYKKLTNSHDGVLLKHAGSLFANNLHCDSRSKEDFKYYKKLTKFIRECDIDVKWFVVYASNRKYFPPYFKRQFKMISLDRKGEKPKGKNIKQIDSGEKLPKSQEYIRLDDNDDMFYAKAKDRTNEYSLKLSGQPYKILNCLFNAYNSKTKKASVPIDTVLCEARIKDHKKGDNISKDKRDHLSSKITPIKDELEDSGFDKDRIKIDGDYCELSIEFRYDI